MTEFRKGLNVISERKSELVSMQDKAIQKGILEKKQTVENRKINKKEGATKQFKRESDKY